MTEVALQAGFRSLRRFNAVVVEVYPLRLDLDRRLMLQFRGSVITSDAGLLAYRAG